MGAATGGPGTDGMSAQILPFPAPSERDRDAVVTTHPFGGCSGCGGADGWHADGYPNDERGHWFFCDRHKTKWRAGSNFLSDRRDEIYEAWLRNRFKLVRYMMVKPVMPSRPG